MGQSAQINGLWQLLRVKDMKQSLAFYVQQLGFDLVAQAAGDDGTIFWCRLKRGNASLMLEQGTNDDPSPNTWGKGVAFYFHCDDVDLFHAELRERGVNPPAPQVAYYGMKQLFIPEPNGYQLCFESETQPATAGADDGGESE